MTMRLPLLTDRRLDDILAWRRGQPVRVREFLADAQALAERLPPHEWLLNVCEDRYHFAVGFAACLLRGTTSLQPSSLSAETLGRLAAQYPGILCLTDGEFASAGLPCMAFPDLDDSPRAEVTEIPAIEAERTVAILFTSGSTGQPQPQRKTWGRLVRNGQSEAQALGLDRRPHVIVATVPAQHSYGFESTFLLALHGGCSFCSSKAFYPQDIVLALQAVPQPRLLVSTPYHLSTLVASGLDLPPVDAVLSATAPLSTALAAQVEQRSGAPVLEIYGSTESSQLACRQTTAAAAWTLLPGVQLAQEGDTTIAFGEHVEGRVPLSDIIELQADRRFVLHGRHADLVNIAGKRTSLAYLNHQASAIPGVADVAFFLPDEQTSDGVTRLTAFVVAPGLGRQQLLAALRERIDAIFLPRPLVLVDALPRNSTGKLPRQALVGLYEREVGHVGG